MPKNQMKEQKPSPDELIAKLKSLQKDLQSNIESYRHYSKQTGKQYKIELETLQEVSAIVAVNIQLLKDYPHIDAKSRRACKVRHII